MSIILHGKMRATSDYMISIDGKDYKILTLQLLRETINSSQYTGLSLTRSDILDQDIFDIISTSPNIKEIRVDIFYGIYGGSGDEIIRLLKINRRIISLTLRGNINTTFISSRFISDILAISTMKQFKCFGNMTGGQTWEDEIIKCVSTNYNILTFCIEQSLEAKNITYEYTERNRQIQPSIVHTNVLEFAICFAPLQLPPYVQLEIFDYLPYMRYANHRQKITILQRVYCAYHPN